MNRRIAYVAKVFPRTSETFVINELLALEAMGEAPAVYSLHRNPATVQHELLGRLAAPVDVIEDIEVDDRKARRAADELAARFGIADEERGRYLPRKYVRLAVATASLLRRDGVEHLHAHFASRAGHVAALATALAGIGYSVTAHAKDIYHQDVDRGLLAWKLARARFAVTVTDYNFRHLKALLAGHGMDAAGLVRLYNGIDLGRFQPTTPGGGRPRVVSIGRLVEKKGFPVLVDACALLAARGLDVECEIIGGGDLEGELRTRIDAAGLAGRVTLAGSLTTEQVAARLGGASLVALPCIVGGDGNVDALPTALLEGMAAGLPLVSTRLSGIPEIVVHGENGLLVEPGDAAGLADAIACIAGDAGLAARMGRAGRRRAEELFDLSRNVAELRRRFLAACTPEGGR